MGGRYLQAQRSGLLQKNIAEACAALGSCTLCPRGCGVDRASGEHGYCRVGRRARVASYGAHFGEESVLVGSKGSGTIFFCGCNLLCRFCQNYDISHQADDCLAVTDRQLASIMVELQSQGCHNINLVTPSHVVPQILAALPEAIGQGLTLPLVFNCGGYELVDTLLLLDGIVDIYMPDLKFWHQESSASLADAQDYPQIMQKAVIEMQRQVGDLQLNRDGLATEGLLCRHLLMPGGLSEAEKIFAFLAEEISTGCYLNIMDQYRPCGEAAQVEGLEEMISADCYGKAVEVAKKLGLTRLDRKDFGAIFRRLIRKSD
jgi:putative pyruvate formate lyase activating enzyme